MESSTIPQEQNDEPKSIEEISNLITQIDKDNIDLPNHIHNLEKELELKKSQVIFLSKKYENKSSQYSLFVILLVLSFWILLR